MPRTRVSTEQQRWSSGSTVLYKAKLPFVNEALFIEACLQKTRMLAAGERDPAVWLCLADRFQQAKGAGRVSHMAEWCKKQAELCRAP